jgi:hypothetical protein
MALGRVVISTRIGMEGIEIEDGVHALLADKPEEWLSRIEWCLANKEQLRKIGVGAVSLCNSSYDHHTIAQRLLGAYRTLLYKS